MNYIRSKHRALIEWACWNAWTYARKREIARRGPDYGIAPVPESAEDQTPGRRRVIANEARQLLENKHFREAFAAVDAAIEAQASSCDPDNKEKAQRVIITKQLMAALRREIVRKAEDGYMAEAQIAELERSRRIPRLVR